MQSGLTYHGQHTIKTPIGKEVLKLVDKWFVTNPDLKKRFNRMTIKVSYSTTRNMKAFITAHNKNLLNQNNNDTNIDQLCNCTRVECPLPNATPQNNCRQKDTVYEGAVRNNDNGTEKTYKGCTSDEFKNRVANHRTTFRHEDKKFSSKMAEAVHNIKNATNNYAITWKIIDKTNSFKAGDSYCKLCTLEKFHILYKNKETDVNKFRLEPCLHKMKYFLSDIR